MAPMTLRRLSLSLFALVALGLFALAGCGGSTAPVATPTPLPTIQVSLLVHISEEDERWFRDMEVPQGTDAYGLTELATEGDLNATYYAQYRSHFVQGLFGVENADPRFWLIYRWNESEAAWEPLPVGADRFSLKEEDVLAWAYADTSQDRYHERLTTPLSPGVP